MRYTFMYSILVMSPNLPTVLVTPTCPPWPEYRGAKASLNTKRTGPYASSSRFESLSPGQKYQVQLAFPIPP